MKLRNVLWPVVIVGALGLAGACSSDGGVAGSGGDDGQGGEGNASGTAGKGSAGSKNTSGSTSTGGASDAGAGGESLSAGASGAAGAGGAGGAAGDLCEGKDLTCEDDDDPCTEDECNPATGECGIPRTGTSCDDGVFCNGDDSCDAGACTEHDGDPCNGQTCNEAEGACECSMDEHCAADVPGEWGECDYATECIETAKRTRLVTTFSCDNGKCVQGATNEEEPCTRETDGTSCADDGNRCNGAESCKAGDCDSSDISPCKSTDPNPYCYQSGDPVCRKCTSTGFSGKPQVGCTDAEYCCGGTCKSTACNVIVNFGNPIVGQLANALP